MIVEHSPIRYLMRGDYLTVAGHSVVYTVLGSNTTSTRVVLGRKRRLRLVPYHVFRAIRSKTA